MTKGVAHACARAATESIHATCHEREHPRDAPRHDVVRARLGFITRFD
jgi:hypothetical protein